MDWPHKISALTVLLKHTGPLWQGTRLSGYGNRGPYHCGDCIYLRGRGSCTHPAVLADEEMPKRDGLAMVDAAKGCCEFVTPPPRSS